MNCRVRLSRQGITGSVGEGLRGIIGVLQPYSQSRRTERPQEVIPAGGSHWQPMDTFLSHRNCTSQNHGTAGNRETGSFVNSAVSYIKISATLQHALFISHQFSDGQCKVKLGGK